MRYGRVIFLIILVGAVIAVHSRVKEPHMFSEEECQICHLDLENNPGSLKPMKSSECEVCHKDRRLTLSHPFDISPEKKVPADLPLVDGELTCFTCHFTHLFSVKNPGGSYFLLRRPGRGVLFCSVCHSIDEKGHILYEKVHKGTFKEEGIGGTLDTYTLQCIECHESLSSVPARILGAGKWQHSGGGGNHPIGISYGAIANKKLRDFNPESLLPEEIRLFDGKIGCGTCHNVYSKEKFMLAVNNYKSKLCMTCHNK